jgi:hypothetical protein
MQQPAVKHLIAVAVAAACVAISLAGGGFEPTAFAAAGLVVWVLAVLGLAVGVAPRSRAPGAAWAAGGALVALAGLMALSLAWGDDDGTAFEDVVRALTYLGGFTLVVLSSKRGEARPWLVGLGVGLTAVCAIALLARFEPSLFGNPDADLAESLPAALGRLTYPIGYWNGLAAVAASAIVLLTWLATTSESRRRRTAAVAALPPVALALWITDSRGGIVAAMIAMAVLLAVGPHRTRLLANLGVGALAAAVLIAIADSRTALLNDPVAPDAAGQGDAMLAITLVVIAATAALRYALDRRLQPLVISRPLARAALAAAAVAALVALVAIDPVEQYDDFKRPPTLADIEGGDVGFLRGGGSGRYQYWETALDAFGSAPVEGVGASGYTPYWFEHRELAIPATRAHSVVFETMAELGLLGLAALIGFFAVASVAGVRRARAPDAVSGVAPALALLALGFAAAAVDWTWDLPAVFGIAVVAVALLTGPATLTGPDAQPPPGRGRTAVRTRRSFAAGIALLVVAWISICGSGLLLLSARALESSRDAAGDADLASAIDAANDAIDLQPWAAEPRTQLALVYEQGGDLDQARAAIGEAIERAPADYRLRLVAARMAFADGDGAAVEAELGAAHRLNPLDPEIAEQIAAAAG